MKRTIVRYTVKPGQEEPNADLVRAVYRELADLKPAGFRYATYRLDDGRTFIHMAEQEGDGDNPLPTVPAFREFQKGVRERCEWGPVAEGAEVIGRYAEDEHGGEERM
jgi:hypothetical protein